MSRAPAVVVTVCLVAALASCAPGGTPSGASTASAPAPAVDAPVPGSTLAPDPGAADVAVPDGLTLTVVLAPGDEEAVLVDALDRWAAEHEVPVEHRVEDDLMDVAAAAQGTGTLVVAPGGALVDALDAASSQNLAVPFLVLGAQLPEPTANVTAVVWAGASARGSRAPADEPVDATTVTAERADAAVLAGVGSVLTGTTGVVLRLPG